MACRQHTLGAKRAQARADARTADGDLPRQLALRRQSLSRLQLSAEDQSADVADDSAAGKPLGRIQLFDVRTASGHTNFGLVLIIWTFQMSNLTLIRRIGRTS